MFPFLNTFKRLISKQQETHTAPQKYSNEQLIQWATGCMLEGLPDDFYQARLLCTRQSDPENPDGWIVNVNHDVMHNPDSEYERFQPADDLYPTQCVEMLLDGKEWSNASITKTHRLNGVSHYEAQPQMNIVMVYPISKSSRVSRRRMRLSNGSPDVPDRNPGFLPVLNAE